MSAKPGPKPKFLDGMKQLNVSFGKEQRLWLESQAVKNRCSLSEVVQACVQAAIYKEKTDG